MPPLYFYMHKPVVVFKGRSEGAFAYPAVDLHITSVSFGSFAAIRDGMTVALGSVDGASDRGRQRSRGASGSGGTGTLYTGQYGRGSHDGEFDDVAGSYVTVYDEYRVWAKVPLNTATDPGGDPTEYTILKDGVYDYPGYVENPNPWANGGPAFADTINSSTGKITVTLSGTNSRSFDVNAAYGSNYDLITVSSYAWEIADGTLTSGTLSSSAITATFPAGFRYVHLTVTGPAPASKTHTTHIPIFARDPDSDACIAHQITSHKAEYGGQELSIRLLEELAYGDYPDGVLVLFWEGSAASPSSRTHMLFVGWEESTDNSAKGTKLELVRESTIKAVDVCGRMRKLIGFPQFLADANPPTDWTHTRIPTMIYYAWFILHWHSTALEVAPFYAPEPIFNLLRFKILAIDEATLYDQVNHLANMTTPDHYFCCTRDGQMIFVVDDNLAYTGDRDPANVFDFDPDSWTEISFSYERAPKVYKLLTYATLGNTTDTSLACQAPGYGLGQGAATVQSNGERLCLDQTNLNITEGNRYARLNATFGRITVRLPYQTVTTVIDPGRIPWVLIYLGVGNEPPRAVIDDTSLRALAWQMEIEYSYEHTALNRMAVFTCEPETFGPAAITITAPE